MRYLAQIEGGYGNPSLIVLKAIADALEARSPPSSADDARAAEPHRRSRQSPVAERNGPRSNNRSRRASWKARNPNARSASRLVGLRGAGKSTLGRILAERLGYPFVELNRVVEQEYGASISMLIEMSGVSTFRRYERASLEKVIARPREGRDRDRGRHRVVARKPMRCCLRRTHTVWIKAQPQEHMNRVMAQGDFRPMSENREAMADLVAILEARSQDYAQAEAELDTSGQTVEQSADDLLGRVAEWTK